MRRLTQYFTSPAPALEEFSEDTEAQALVSLLETDDAKAREVLRLLDGVEAYTEPPALELPSDLLLPAISQEDYLEALSKFWEMIKQWFKSLLQYVVDDYATTHLAARALKFQAENLNARGGELINIGSRATPIVVNKHLEALSVNYRPASNIGEVISGLKVLEKTLKGYLQYTDQILPAKLKEFTGKVNSLRPAELDSSRAAYLAQILHSVNPASRLAEVFQLREDGGNRRYLGQQLLGNRRIQVTTPNGLHGGVSRLRELTEYSVTLRHAELNPRAMPGKVEMQRFNAINFNQCTTQVIRMVDDVIAATANQQREKTRAVLNELFRAMEKFEAKLQNESNPIDHGRQARELLEVGKTVAQWLTNPHRGLLTNSMQSMRAALWLCRENLR